MADSKILRALKESTANSGPLRHSKPDAKFTLIPGSDQTREIDNLSGPELIYNFLKSCGKEVIGDPTTAFAVYDECDGILRTYGKPLYRDEANEYPWIKGKFQALEKAKESEQVSMAVMVKLHAC
jgi:hypothetical protein